MAAAQPRPEIIVIAGPTAAGKTQLAMRLAKEFGGEIIAADSRTVYKGMDIGTAKPPASERKQIPHWGLDLVKPGEPFSAAAFQVYAREKLEDIQKRGNLPVVAGGTGLYIEGLIYNYQFKPPVSPQERSELEKLTTEQLRAKIKHMGFKMPQNAQNRRHLARVIERRGQTGGRGRLPEGVLLVGLLPPDDILRQKIAERAGNIFDQGVIEETGRLVRAYGKEAIERTGGIVYKIVLRHLRGEISREKALELFKAADWQYARRQKTWFKRNPDIPWFSSEQEAYRYLRRALSN